MLKPQKKITRKELKHDPLMNALYRLRHGWLEHRAIISKFAGGVLVILVLSVLIMRWRGTQDDLAATAVGVAFVEFSQGNYNTVIAQLSPHVDKFVGLKSFGNGLYLLARSELLVGDSLGAERHYSQYLDDYGRDPLMACGALAGLGVIAEGQGAFGEAAEQFRKASRRAPTAGFRKQYAIYAGRSFLLAGLPEDALKILRPLLDEQGLEFQMTNDVQALVASAEAQIKQGGGA